MLGASPIMRASARRACLALTCLLLIELSSSAAHAIAKEVADTEIQVGGGGGEAAAATVFGDGNNSGFIPDFLGGAADVGLSDVNQSSGAYTFNIPLPVPPGINDMAPSVSVVYSSDGSKDTLLGAGFELAAGDCIARRAPTHVRADGTIVSGVGTPQFSDTDTFYYQGQRLVACDGSQTCPSGSFRTEQDNFERIRLQTSAVPNGFEVTKRDGTVVEYANGLLAYGRSDTFDNYTAYCISRVSRLGNEVAYTYKNFGRNGTTDLGYDFYVMDKIEYGGRPPAGHRWRIQFNWGTRPAADVRSSYGSGGLTRNVKRLESIEVFALGTPLKRMNKLEIAYEALLSQDSSRSRVQSIVMRGESDSDILPGYSFSYAASSPTGWTGSEIHNGGPEGLDNNNIFTKWGHFNPPYYDDYTAPVGTEVVDINGDGLSDLIRHDDQLDKKVYIYNGTAWVDQSATWGTKLASVDHFIKGSAQDSYDNGVRFADINSDGHQDIVRALYLDGAYQHKVWLYDPLANSGTGGFDSTSSAATAFDNAIGINSVAFTLRKTIGGKLRTVGAGTVFADVNGDGLVDIITGRGGDLVPSHQILLNNGESFVPGSAGYYDTLPVSLVDARTNLASIYWGTQIGDLNGDGLPDLVMSYEHWNYQPDGNYRGIYCPSTGPYCEMIKTRQCPGGNCRTVSVWINNGHGWDDLSSQWNTSLTPDTIEPLQEVFHIAGSNDFLHNYPRGAALVDINSDGFADLVQSYCQAPEGPHPVNPVADCTHTKTYLGNGNGVFSLSSAWRLPFRADANVVGVNSSYFFEYSFGRDDIGYCTCPYAIEYDGGMKLDDLSRDGGIDVIMNRYSYVGQYGFVKKNQLRFDRDLLTNITDPFGQQVVITYKLIGGGDSSPDTSGAHASVAPLLPFRKPVVASIGRSNGSTANPLSITKSFNYYGGRYDEVKRSFAGFRLVTASEPSPSGIGQVVTASWFKNGAEDFCHPGAPEASMTAANECVEITPGSGNYVCLYDGSVDLLPVLSVDTITRLNIKQLSRQVYDNCAPEAAAPYFSPLRETFDWNIEGAYPLSGSTHVVGIETKRTFDYDIFGNSTVVAEYLYSSDATPYRKLVTDYSAPNLADWIVNTQCSIDYRDGAGTSLKTDQFYYDNNTTFCATPSQGLPSEHRLIVRARNGVPETTSITRFTYTGAGNVESVIDPRGNPSYTYWNSSLPEIVPARAVNALNQQTTYGYDEFGNLTSLTDPNNITMWAHFDNFQRIYETGVNAAANDPAPLVTYGYQLTRNPNTQYTLVTSKIDATRSVKQFSYFDGFRSTYLETVRDQNGTINISTSYGYNSAGILSKTTLPYSGSTFTLNKTYSEKHFDLLGRAISSVSPGGYTSSTVYSIYEPPSGGSLYWEDVSAPNQSGADPKTRRRHTLSDPMRRAVQVTECNTENCSSPATISPDIYTTKYLYDVQGGVTDICTANAGESCASASSKIKLFYDGMERLIARKDPNLSNCADPTPDSVSSGCPWRLSYDLSGNMVQMVDAVGHVTNFMYDQLDRLNSRMSWGVGNGGREAWYYLYDQPQAGRYNIGRMTSITTYSRPSYSGALRDATRQIFGYDSLGRLRQKDMTLTITGRTSRSAGFQYGYLNDGSLASIVMPSNPAGETVSYSYDKLGRPSAISSSMGGPIVSLVQYNPIGQMSDVVWGLGSSNEVHLRYDYRSGTIGTAADDRRLSRIWTPELGLLDLSYQYDNSGNITRLTDGISGRVHEPRYDRLNRVTDFWLDNGWHDTFGLDAVGNRISWTKSVPGHQPAKSPITRSKGKPVFAEPLVALSTTLNSRFGDAFAGDAGPHAVRCIGTGADPCVSPSQTFSYDRNGNMSSSFDALSGVTTNYSYNYVNKLSSVSSSGGTTTNYYYGENAERFAVVYGASESYYFDPTYELRDGSPVSHYFLNGQRVASRWGGGNIKYLLSDHADSVRTVIDPSNISVPEYSTSYLPHGEPLDEVGASANLIKFNGHQKDLNGLYDFDARTYSSRLGVFMQPDSIIPDLVDPQSFNRYAFPNNNPSTLSDPTGHEAEPGDYSITSTHYTSDLYNYYYDDFWYYWGDDYYFRGGGYRLTADSVFPCRGCETEVSATRLTPRQSPAEAPVAAAEPELGIWAQSFKDGIIPTGDYLYDGLQIFSPLPYIAYPANLVNNAIKRGAAASGAPSGVASTLGFIGMLLTPGPDELVAGAKGIQNAGKLKGIVIGQWEAGVGNVLGRLEKAGAENNLKVLNMRWLNWWKEHRMGRFVGLRPEQAPKWMVRAHDGWWIIWNHYVLRHPMQDIGWASSRGYVKGGGYEFELKLIDFLDNKLHLPHGPRIPPAGG